jgi:hypothetical protein
MPACFFFELRGMSFLLAQGAHHLFNVEPDSPTDRVRGDRSLARQSTDGDGMNPEDASHGGSVHQRTGVLCAFLQGGSDIPSVI